MEGLLDFCPDDPREQMNKAEDENYNVPLCECTGSYTIEILNTTHAGLDLVSGSTSTVRSGEKSLHFWSE